MRNKARHLAVVIPDLRGGGAERVMVILANHFAARGHKVDLVLGRAVGAYLGEVLPNVHVKELGVDRMAWGVLPLVRYIRDARPDAMLSALNHVNMVALIARKLSGVRFRLVISERNSLDALEAGWRSFLNFQLMRFLYPSADGVIAVTRAGAEELIGAFKLSRDKVFSIPNPLDISRITSLSAEPIQHPWFASGAPPVILGVGRLVEQKDFATLIRAFGLLLEETSARLVILGEGPLRGELQRHIDNLGLGDYVHLAGFQENPYKWMARSKVFVLSSRYEGFPNVLAQALACGAQVVSTDCPTGPAEIIKDGVPGCLVPVGDPVAMMLAIREALRISGTLDKKHLLVDLGVDQVTSAYLSALCVEDGAAA